MVLDDDAPHVRFLKEKRVRARKAHRCVWCGQTIKVGELYKYTVFIEDYCSFHTVKEHLPGTCSLTE